MRNPTTAFNEAVTDAVDTLPGDPGAKAASADAVSLGTTGQRFAALEARIAALEARLLAPPAVAGTPSPESVAVFPGGFVPAHDVSDEVRASLRACNVDHDTCSAEQRSGTGRAAQGTCVRGVVDLVAASADDQHAAERGTPAAGAEVTASEGGDTARDDSVVAEAVDMLVKADAHERVAAALDPYDSARRAELMYAAKGLRRAAEERIEVVGERLLLAEAGVLNLSKRLAEARAERDAANAKVESMRSGVREMEAERDAMRHELAEMRAELERERVRRKAADDALSKSVSGEHRKWATAIASALDRVDYSGCESFVGREEMAARVAAMRAELERERKLRRESEEAFKAESMRRDLAGANLGRELALKREQEVTAERDAQRHELAEMRAELERERVRRRAAEDALSKAARDPRSEEARKRGLTIGARVRAGLVRGVVVGWSDGNPLISWANPTLGERQAVWCARDVELDTEATT